MKNIRIEKIIEEIRSVADQYQSLPNFIGLPPMLHTLCDHLSGAKTTDELKNRIGGFKINDTDKEQNPGIKFLSAYFEAHNGLPVEIPVENEQDTSQPNVSSGLWLLAYAAHYETAYLLPQLSLPTLPAILNELYGKQLATQLINSVSDIAAGTCKNADGYLVRPGDLESLMLAAKPNSLYTRQ